MEDIVDRLRVLNFMGPWKEAADEIERLRKELEELSENIGLQRDDAAVKKQIKKEIDDGNV